MPTLITGASGFIGRHLVLHLLMKFPKETLFTVGRSNLAMKGVKHYRLDLSKGKELLRVLKSTRPDKVYHLAGIARVSEKILIPDYFRINFLTSVSLMKCLEELASPVSLFLASSAQVYGNQAGIIDERTEPSPVSPYGFIKYLVEEALHALVLKNGSIRAVVGRLSTIIGPGQAEGFVISDLCHKIIRLPKKPEGTLKVGSLSASRQFLDVEDAVVLFPKLLERIVSKFEVYNIAAPDNLQIGEVLEILLKISGKSARIRSRETEHRNQWLGNKMNIAKLKEVTPHHRFLPIQESLERAYRWTEGRC